MSGGSSTVAVLFDFGGTLDANGVPWKERLYRLYRTEGVPVASEQFDPLFYAVDDAMIGTVSPTLRLRDTIWALVKGVTEALGLEDHALAHRVADRFLAEAMERLHHNAGVLGRLSRGYRLGIVSNFYGNLDAVCEDVGIRRFFTTVMDSGRTGDGKPHPRIFHQALHALGADATHALFVGDSFTRDMAGARAVGMRHIWLTPGTREDESPCCPGDRVIHSLDELEEGLP